jgi:hypothetical protein
VLYRVVVVDIDEVIKFGDSLVRAEFVLLLRWKL